MFISTFHKMYKHYERKIVIQIAHQAVEVTNDNKDMLITILHKVYKYYERKSVIQKCLSQVMEINIRNMVSFYSVTDD